MTRRFLRACSLIVLTVLPILAATGVTTLGTARARADDVNAELLRYYAKERHYRAVKKDVLAWHKTTRNACVAFVSEALRHIGVAVPRDGKIDGAGISRITLAFSIHLEEDLGWTRSMDLAELAPGDVVFTEDDPCCDGYPAHVMVFVGWKDRKRKVAMIIDNQGFTHARALTGGGDEVSPYAYALRAPSP